MTPPTRNPTVKPSPTETGRHYGHLPTTGTSENCFQALPGRNGGRNPSRLVGNWAALHRLAQRPRTDPIQPRGSPRFECPRTGLSRHDERRARISRPPQCSPVDRLERGRSSLHNRIVAFEGEVMPQYNVPLLHRFVKEDAAPLQLQELPTSAPSHAAEFYLGGKKTTIFICAQSHPLATIRAAQSRWTGAASQFR